MSARETSRTGAAALPSATAQACSWRSSRSCSARAVSSGATTPGSIRAKRAAPSVTATLAEPATTCAAPHRRATYPAPRRPRIRAWARTPFTWTRAILMAKWRALNATWCPNARTPQGTPTARGRRRSRSVCSPPRGTTAPCTIPWREPATAATATALMPAPFGQNRARAKRRAQLSWLAAAPTAPTIVALRSVSRASHRR